MRATAAIDISCSSEIVKRSKSAVKPLRQSCLRYPDLMDTVLLAVDSWNLGDDEGLELVDVQVSPAAFPMVVLWRTSMASWTRRLALVGNEGFNRLSFTVDRHVVDEPRAFDAEKLFLELTITHSSIGYAGSQ